jgi:hypothetical protein
VKEWRLIKVVPMDFEEGILLKGELIQLLPKELPDLQQDPLNHGGPTGHMNGFHLNILILKVNQNCSSGIISLGFADDVDQNHVF